MFERTRKIDPRRWEIIRGRKRKKAEKILVENESPRAGEEGEREREGESEGESSKSRPERELN